MPRSLRRIPDYFTEEEAGALVDAAPSYPARMAFRIMLKTGLRVSEAWHCGVWTCAWTSTRRSSSSRPTRRATRAAGAGRPRYRLT